MISLSFLLLSWGSFAMPLFLISSLLISPSLVPLAWCPFDGARPSFDWSGHEPRRWLLQPVLLHPPSLLLHQVVVWLSRPSWHSLSAWMLALTLLVISCVRWTPVLVILHDDRLSWMVSLRLYLHLHRLPRTRVIMLALVMMMLMKMRMLALPVKTKWLLLSDLPFLS